MTKSKYTKEGRARRDLLFNWLASQRLKSLYIKRMRESKDTVFNENYFIETCNDLEAPIAGLHLKGFFWLNTPEGGSYWSQINHKWLDYYSTLSHTSTGALHNSNPKVI